LSFEPGFFLACRIGPDKKHEAWPRLALAGHRLPWLAVAVTAGHGRSWLAMQAVLLTRSLFSLCIDIEDSRRSSETLVKKRILNAGTTSMP